MSPVLSFFIKISLAIQDLLWFHINSKIVSSTSVKNAFGILINIHCIYKRLWEVLFPVF